MGTLDFTEKLILWIIPVLFAVTLHEVGHGLCANYFGDPTAKLMKRLSFNPIRHIDPIGSIAVPLGLLWLSGFIFGWAKPVPVITRNLNHPKKDMIFVAAAGPFANLIMTLFWAICFKIGLFIVTSQLFLGETLIYMGAAGVFINSALMMLNLFPILPLDGGRILNGFLPEKLSRWHAKTEVFGLPVLLLLMFTGFIQKYLLALIFLSISSATTLTNIPLDQLTHALTIMMGTNVKF